MAAAGRRGRPRAQPTTERVISDVETLKALSDPVRLRILETMVTAADEAWTVKRLAAALGTNPTKLYHHINILEERELIVVAGTRVVSGIIETSYRIAQLSLRLDRALLSGAGPDVRSSVHDVLAVIFDSVRDEIERGLASGLIKSADDPLSELLIRGLTMLPPDRAAELRQPPARAPRGVRRRQPRRGRAGLGPVRLPHRHLPVPRAARRPTRRPPMTDQALPAALSARDVLRIPGFRRLWLGQLVSEAGDGLTNLALLLLVNHLTGSTAAIAAMAICLAIPPLTIGLFAGAYVDRADRRRIMLASDLLRAGTSSSASSSSAAPTCCGCCSSWRSSSPASARSSRRPARAVLPKVVPAEGPPRRELGRPGDAGRRRHRRCRPRRPAHRPGRGLLAGVRARLAVLPRLVRADPRPAGRRRRGSNAAPATDGRRRWRRSPGSAPASGLGLSRVAHSRLLSTTILSLAVVMLGLGAVNVLFVPLLIRVLEVNPAWFGARRPRPERLDDPRRRDDRRRSPPASARRRSSPSAWSASPFSSA